MWFGTHVCTFLAFQPKPCRALLKSPQAPHYHRYRAGTAHWHSHLCFVWLQGCLVCAGAVCAENEGLISMSKQIFLLLCSCSVAFTFPYFASCLHAESHSSVMSAPLLVCKAGMVRVPQASVLIKTVICNQVTHSVKLARGPPKQKNKKTKKAAQGQLFFTCWVIRSQIDWW